MKIDPSTIDWEETGNWPVVLKAKIEGLTLRIGYEEDSRFANPRDNECNLGVIVGWHPDYVLGDFQLKGGAVETIFETERGRTEFASMEHVERYLHLALGAVVTIPLYLYDHSGISLSAGAPNPFDNPRVRSDHHGNGLGWDTSMVGYIYTTRERIAELCGDPQIPTDPFYCPRTWPADGRSGRNWEGSAVEWIAQQLKVEVDVYDQFLRGEVYWYSIEDADGDICEGCGGFLGGGIDANGKEISPIEYVQQEAIEAAQGVLTDLAEAARVEAIERERAANMDVATIA